MWYSNTRRWGAWSLNGTGLRLLSVLAVGALCGLGLTHVFLRHVGQDQAWCLYAANLVMHGVQLSGPQLVEVNPPFIVWFSCVPVLFSALIHQSTLQGFRFFFDLLVLASVTYTVSLIAREFFYSRLVRWLCFGLFISAHFWLIYGDSLGQREQLLVLFISPYLVWAALRGRQIKSKPDHKNGLTAPMPNATPSMEGVFVGLLGAVGVCLKPQHLLVILMVEGLLWIRCRSLRCTVNGSFFALLAGLTAYGVAVFAFGRAYIATTVPLLRLTYASLNQPYLHLFTPTVIIVLCALGTGWLLAVRLGHITDRSGLSSTFGVAAIASTLAYFQQHKGWSYQFIPAGMFTVLFLGFLLLETLESRTQDVQPRKEAPSSSWDFAVGAMMCLCCIIINLSIARRSDYFTEKKKILAGIFAEYPSGVSVSYIAVEPWAMPLVMEQNKILGQRMNYFWLLPAIIQNQDPRNSTKQLTPDQVSFLSNEQRNSTIEDLQRWKPVVVVFDQCGPSLCQALEREGYKNVLGWYLSDPRFARVWSSYRFSKRIGDLEAFRRVQ